ncbi:unnamed protein product [Rhizoctonia solani]|uniref:Uncharacterized protein n=1 Tax=Rhizoctonia solani TaxID=456999 RepID=A0A8H2WBN3_9AGAM|nr:unnamed protein product [Rhizoctonia solani]
MMQHSGGHITFPYSIFTNTVTSTYKYSQERLGIDESTRLLGRVPGIAAGRELKLPDLKFEEATPINPGSIAPPQIKRGKRFATPAIWDMKEPYSASNERQIWMTSLVIGDWTQKNVDQDPEGSNPSLGFPTVRYPVRASVPPRANLRNRGVGDVSMLKGARRIPYLCIINPNLRRLHRGLSPKIIESCCQENHSLKISLYGNPRLLQPGFVAWFILIIAVNDKLQDPEHDLNFWKKMLNDPTLKSEAIYFASIAGDGATPERIYEGIVQLFHDSEALGISDHAKLVVYLTGSGDNQNRMCLPDKKYLAKEEIKKWAKCAGH